MKLQRDILLADFESFGDDLERSPVVLLAGLVLDKDSGLVKSAKHWYLRHSWLASVTEEHARLVGVEPTVISSALKPLEAAREFEKAFAGNILLAVPNANKLIGLRYFFRRLTMPFPFEGQVLDLSSIYWLFGHKLGWKKSPSLPSLSEHFGRKFTSFHDPIERLKLQAEIFVKVINQI